ncbi:DUF1049 domain-containing protein [Erythrobacter sp. HKB08]|uniref:DUF1049 domain-containing protein n=1 Tax=Erythrobacter sp. HKB08 TaxID=2502843 RepID=UPI001008E95F|nr:DUF1049 domain-containing protein [Erythrobacter sp. HKB08]
MQIVRTIAWILLLVGLLAFSFGNWDKQIDVRIWPGLVWDTRVPAVVIVSFLAGLIPTWMLLRGTKWTMNRRIRSLENAIKANTLSRTTASEDNNATSAAPAPAPAPAATETKSDLGPA